MREEYVDTPQQLKQLCDALEGSPWLALDTEFIREKSYYPRLCLLQVSNGEVAAIVDVVALESWERLLTLLYQPGIVKVFHAASQDLEIFQLLRGDLPTPLFDTQPAAALLGQGEQVGYGDLVMKELGVTLEKGQGRTDWMRRPLSEKQIRYALDDVVYLGPLYQRIRERLEQRGRLEWLREEFAALADPATYRVDPEQAWRKVKGRNRLSGQQLAVLQQLAAWREEVARERDRPRRWILKDELLLDLARRMPESVAAIATSRGFDAGVLERHGETLVAQVRKGRQLPRGQWPRERTVPLQLSDNQQAQVDLLSAVLRLKANQHGINPAAIAGRRELERMVCGDPESSLLHGWRRSVAGETLQQLLEGRCVAAVQGGSLSLLDAQTQKPLERGDG